MVHKGTIVDCSLKTCMSTRYLIDREVLQIKQFLNTVKYHYTCLLARVNVKVSVSVSKLKHFVTRCWTDVVLGIVRPPVVFVNESY